MKGAKIKDILKNRFLFTIFLLLYGANLFSNPITLKNNIVKQDISEQLLFYQDFDGKITLNEIINQLDRFESSGQKITNLGTTNITHWVTCEIKNQSNSNIFLLQIESPLLDLLEIYEIEGTKALQQIYKFDNNKSYNQKKYDYPNHIVDISIGIGKSKKYLFKIKSGKELILPVVIGSKKGIIEPNHSKDILFGMFSGMVLIMLLYNLFIYFSVRDKSYLYYVIYIFFLGLTQNIIQGYGIEYVRYYFPWLAVKSVYFCGALVGMSVIWFLMSFLNTKKSIPKLHKLLYIIIVSDTIALFLAIFKFYNLSYNIIDITAGIGSFYVLFIVIKLSIEGNRSAKIFLIAWVTFLFGVIIFVLRSHNILPYNNYTNYTMLIGAIIELLLLSFALADKINIMRKEKEESQQKTVEVLQENEKIILEQNIILEQKVEERTTELNKILNHLKETQSQLVDAEKMSSLGQLTAGIAHEINNPINFVSSNITPLRQDLDDINTIIKKYEEIKGSDNIEEKLLEIEKLKKELDFNYLKTELSTIIDGIEDGAKRTTEIVSGLRNFSRLDEGGLKKVNINEGIEATLVLIRNKLNGIKVDKLLDNIPNIECNLGKLNQMFMNLLDNAIYAIEKKDIENKNGLINVITKSNTTSVILIIKDNGVGIDNKIKEKLFDPFFTTKDVGEGTGLGLSIVRSIVDSHNGKITINSEINKGTEITIEIPIKQ